MKTPVYPNLSIQERTALMEVPKEGKVPIVIDSDTFNEIDDQFAISWALLQPERLDLRAIYAAPFTNSLFGEEQTHHPVSDAETGMKLSFEEIHRVLDKLPKVKRPQILEGSCHYLKDCDSPMKSPAVIDLIERAMNQNELLHVLSIGAPTNIAHALLLEPKLVHKIHVIWLGGHSFDWHNTQEFNLMQDIDASRVILNSGVALTLIPCMGVTNTLATSIPEIQYYLSNTSRIGSYLAEVAPNCPWLGFASRKVIWDIATVGYALNEDWYASNLVPSPILNDNLTWSFDNRRHAIRVIRFIDRDELFKDMFKSLIDADK